MNKCKQINRWHRFISPCIRGKLGVADALVLLLALLDKVGNEQLFVGSETRKSATDWSNKSVNLAAYLAKVGLSFFIVSKQGLWFLLEKMQQDKTIVRTDKGFDCRLIANSTVITYGRTNSFLSSLRAKNQYDKKLAMFPAKSLYSLMVRERITDCCVICTLLARPAPSVGFPPSATLPDPSPASPENKL